MAGSLAPLKGGKKRNLVKKKTIAITRVKIMAVAFKSDHGVLKDYNVDWEDGGALFAEPEWTSISQHPVSHTRRKQVDIELTIVVEPADATKVKGSVTGEGPDGIVFKKSGYTFKGGTSIIPLKSAGKLKNRIQVLDFAIKWKTTGVGVAISPTETKNKMYVTWGVPMGSECTVKRLDWVCNLCSNLADAHACVKEIHDSTGSFDLSAGRPDPLWKIAGGATAQCMDLSKFYELATRMLGIPGGNVVYLYPKVGKHTKESTSGGDNETRGISATHTGSTTHDDHGSLERIALIDFNGGWNNFEACFKFRHGGVTKYYGGGAGIYDTAQKVMENVCQRTEWVYQTGPNTWDICTNPGPSPLEIWSP